MVIIIPIKLNKIMTIKNINFKDLLYNTFVIIDDLLKFIPKPIGKKVWRKPSLSASEILSMIVFWLFKRFKTIADLYRDIVNNYKTEFPNMPKYKNFNSLVLNYSIQALHILQIIMWINTNNSNKSNNIKFIDATPVAVCKNKRIFNHKVAYWIAERWKSSMWWFYWFKLHIIVDNLWNLLSCSITPWNIDDRKPVLNLSKQIKWLLIGDAWYLSSELTKELYKKWITFITWVKANMKKLMTQLQNKYLKARQIVETWFWTMKDKWNLVSSFARSVWWHFARIVYSLLSYSLSFIYDDEKLLIS